MIPAIWSTLIAKSKEHFSAYNLLAAVDHFLLLRTLHLDSKDHLLLVLLLFVWLLFLSLLHGLLFSIPRHPYINSLFFPLLLSPWVTIYTNPWLTAALSEPSLFAQLHGDFAIAHISHVFLLNISL